MYYGYAAYYTSGQRINYNDCSDDAGSNFVWKLNVTTSIPLSYANWNSGEPNCSGGVESCIQIRASNNYGWNDINCANTECPICQIDVSF